ncbi:hypothetical protein BDQ94DRAFT_147518, partial [Aspergillus welwitschiae]
MSASRLLRQPEVLSSVLLTALYPSSYHLYPLNKVTYHTVWSPHSTPNPTM